MTVSGARTLTSIGVSSHVISQMPVSATLPKVMVPPPKVTSTLTTPRVTQTVIGDHMPSFLTRYMLPPGSREYPYGCQLQ